MDYLKQSNVVRFARKDHGSKCLESMQRMVVWAIGLSVCSLLLSVALSLAYIVVDQRLQRLEWEQLRVKANQQSDKRTGIDPRVSGDP